MKRKNFIIITNIIALIALILSYYVKKRVGYVFYNWIMILFIIIFIMYSIIISFAYKEKIIIWEQILTCVLLFLIVKFDFSDRFALLFEVPKVERRIEEMKRTGIQDEQIFECDDYMIIDWEPGFLDYQWVLVYDEKDSLQNVQDSKLMLSEGKLYILYKAKPCFYLCVLYR